MKGALLLVGLLCACAGPGVPSGPPLQSSELPRLDDVPTLLRPADGDYVRGGPLLRGGLAWDRGDQEHAASRLESAKRAPSAPPSAWALHAWVLLESVGPRPAESVAREGLAAFPASASLRAALAAALLERGGAAGGAARQSGAGSEALLAQDLVADASALLDDLLDERPADGWLLLLSARAAAAQGRHALTLQRLDRLAMAGPVDSDALLLRARALEGVDRPGEAVPLYQQLVEEAGDNPLLLEEMAFAVLRAARADGDSAHYARAAALLERVTELDPQHAEAWAGRGEAAHARGLPDDAVEAWQRALELQPDDVRSGLALAVLLRESGDVEQAEALLRGLLLQPLDEAEAVAVRAALEAAPELGGGEEGAP